jgi:hypothetical protein
MPSATEFLDELKGANQRLNDVKALLQSLQASVDNVAALNGYANQALFHNAQQNDTIICILEHISSNTCALLNEAAVQTRLQRSIEESTRKLAALFAASHAEAALAFETQEELRQQIEKCCPPPTPQPPCQHERCKAPGPLEPPRTDRPVIERSRREK